MQTRLTAAKLLQPPHTFSNGARTVSSASACSTSSTQGQAGQVAAKASPAPEQASYNDGGLTTAFDPAPNTMNSQLSLVSEPDCKNPTLGGLSRPNPLDLIAQDQHDIFFQYMQKLVQTMTEANLIGPVLPASVITALARSRKARLPNLSFRALELAERIMEYDPLIVDGVEIGASTLQAPRTGRWTGYIQLAWTGNCNDSTVTNCIKRPEQLRLEQERLERGQARLVKRLDRERSERFNQMTQERKHRTDPDKQEEDDFRNSTSPDSLNDVYVENPELLEYMRSRMVKDSPKLKMPVIKNGI